MYPVTQRGESTIIAIDCVIAIGHSLFFRFPPFSGLPGQSYISNSPFM